MLNLYDAVRVNPSYAKLVIGDFLFAEYTCGVNDRLLPNWTEKDYFVHIVTGTKTWHTSEGVWTAVPGDTLFFKKGATVVEQHLDADVCLLMVFIPDALMRSTLREVLGGMCLRTMESARSSRPCGWRMTWRWQRCFNPCAVISPGRRNRPNRWCG